MQIDARRSNQRTSASIVIFYFSNYFGSLASFIFGWIGSILIVKSMLESARLNNTMYIKFFERKRSIDVLDVLEEWIMINGKPKRIMHDNGKQFTSNMFKRFLEHNDIKDKPIPNSYPQLQGKIEAYIY